jgi:hypothetical protein
VLFDLKSGELTRQDIGQMDMYDRMMDDFKRDASVVRSLRSVTRAQSVALIAIWRYLSALFVVTLGLQVRLRS